MKSIILALTMVGRALAGDMITSSQAKAILNVMESQAKTAAGIFQGNVAHGVLWHTDYAKAIEVGELEDKPLLVLFTMPTNCRYCVVLERFHEEHAELLHDFVCVKMPTDKETLATWGVTAYPTQFVVRGGKIKRRWKGLFTQDSGRFGEELRRARDEQ